MADAAIRKLNINPALSRRTLALEDENRFRGLVEFRPDRDIHVLDPSIFGVPITPPEQPPPQPPPTPPEPEAGPVPPAPPPVPLPPQAPPADPFAELPYPNAGDRIKAEDFRKLSQGLRTIADAFALAGATFGAPFGQAKLALRSQGYEIARVVSVSGAELAGPDDSAFDDRKVVSAVPAALGQKRVDVVVTETAQAIDRRMPNLLGLTYRQASERLQQQIGDVVAGGGPMAVPRLVGKTLSEAERGLAG